MAAALNPLSAGLFWAVFGLATFAVWLIWTGHKRLVADRRNWSSALERLHLRATAYIAGRNR